MLKKYKDKFKINTSDSYEITTEKKTERLIYILKKIENIQKNFS